MDTGWTEGRPVTLKADLSISYSGELKQELPLQIKRFVCHLLYLLKCQNVHTLITACTCQL